MKYTGIISTLSVIALFATAFSTDTMAVKKEHKHQLTCEVTNCQEKCVKGLKRKCDLTIENSGDEQFITVRGCKKKRIEKEIETVSVGCKGCTIECKKM